LSNLIGSAFILKRGDAMKSIDAIIKPSKLDDVKQRIREVGVRAMTLSNVTDCGSTAGRLRICRGASYLIDGAPMVRIQIIVDEDMVNTVVDAILATALPGEVDNGSISIYPVAETMRIRIDARPSVAIGDRHLDRARVA
jgi:nitrogen regulatory protein P-II 1